MSSDPAFRANGSNALHYSRLPYPGGNDSLLCACYQCRSRFSTNTVWDASPFWHADTNRWAECASANGWNGLASRRTGLSDGDAERVPSACNRYDGVLWTYGPERNQSRGCADRKLGSIWNTYSLCAVSSGKRFAKRGWTFLTPAQITACTRP